jgi:peptide/nickel transport system permease protein
MGKLIASRILTMIPIMVVVSFGVTALVLLIPGDAAITLAGGVNAQPAKIEQIRDQLHLNESVFQQYGRWLAQAIHGNFGNSLETGQPITPEFAERIQVTLQLVGLTLVFVLLIVTVFGFVGGLWPGSVADRALLTMTSFGIACPAFLVGIILIVIFSVRVHWLPPFGYVPWSSDPFEWFRHMVLPAVSLSALPGAIVARQLRGGLADTVRAPFVRTAWAKGGTTFEVFLRHVLRNSSMPAVTVLGLEIGVLLGGTVIVENIFNLPGLGTYLVQAIGFQDIPVIQAVAVFFVFVRMLVNLAVDIAYGFIDPRVRV